MRILVAGLGSMGKRRIRNLQALGTDVVGFDVSAERREQSAGLYGIGVAESLDSALEGADAMVISTPPNLHKEHAMAAIGRGIPFFTEVNTMDPGDMQQIVDLCAERGVVGMPSCNIAFHPSFRRIRGILDGGGIGRPLVLGLHSGAYLPDWHPWERMSDYYVHRRETGGGRDQIMWELGWVFQIMGRPRTVFAHAKKLGDFDADIFDTYDLQVEFEGGGLGSIVVDVIQRPPSRYCDIIGAEGTIKWDYDNGVVKCWNGGGGGWATYPEKDDCSGYPVEKPRPGFATKDVGMAESYVDEMREFVGVVNGKAPRFTLGDERILLQTMFEAEASSESGFKWDVR